MFELFKLLEASGKVTALMAVHNTLSFNYEENEYTIIDLPIGLVLFKKEVFIGQMTIDDLKQKFNLI